MREALDARDLRGELLLVDERFTRGVGIGIRAVEPFGSPPPTLHLAGPTLTIAETLRLRRRR